jgi:hypothetical protein
MAGVIQDPSGDLYGTTYLCCGVRPDGTVYKITPAGSAGTQSRLATFTGHNGSSPYAPPARDAADNLYGTTSTGGTHGLGTIYEVLP